MVAADVYAHICKYIHLFVVVFCNFLCRARIHSHHMSQMRDVTKIEEEHSLKYYYYKHLYKMQILLGFIFTVRLFAVYVRVENS